MLSRLKLKRDRMAGCLIMWLGALAVAPAIAHAGTLDQFQPNASRPMQVEGPELAGGGISQAQVFTAGLSGGLDQVDIFVGHAGPRNSAGLTVEIRDATGGVPTTSVWGTSHVPSINVPSVSADWISVAFNPPIPVSAGTRWAIVVYTGGSDKYDWFEADSSLLDNAFSGSGSPPLTWSSRPGDLAFKTYVATDVTPPVVSCSATPASLKSNNHKLMAITTNVTVDDEAGGSGSAGFTLVSVQSNQPDAGVNAGDMPNDIQDWTTGTGDTSGLVRQERFAEDRVYTFTYQGSDLAGNSATCQTTVTVMQGN